MGGSCYTEKIMTESGEKNEQKGPAKFSRRTILGGTSVLAAGAVAAAAQGPTGLSNKIIGHLGHEAAVKRLEHEYHAAELYMNHANGRLRTNFFKLRDLSTQMQNGTFDGRVDDERSALLDAAVRPILAERDAILRELDRELFPKLLATYVEHGVVDKSLVKVYEKLGGHLERVREHGIGGIDKEIAARIMSKMAYSLQTDRRKQNTYGRTYYSPVHFEPIAEQK